MGTVEQDTKLHLHNLWLHDTQQKMLQARAASALGFGLDPSNYARPFPGSSTNITVQETRSGSVGKTAGVLAAGLLGGGGMAAAAAALLGLLAARGPSESESVKAANAEAGARVRVYWDDQEIKPGTSAEATLEK